MVRIAVAVLLSVFVALTAADCVWYETLINNDGGGPVWYLDRHELACPDGRLMRSYKLQIQGTGKINYRYSCCSVTTIGECEVHYTNWAQSGDQTWHLDRVPFDCGEGHLLKGLKLERLNGNSDHLRYRYTCCAVTTEKCENKWTNFGSDCGGKNWCLDTQNIECSGNSMIQSNGMQLVPGKWRHYYQCCKVVDNPCTHPTDNFERIFYADNSLSNVPFRWSLTKRVGTSYVGSASEDYYTSTNITSETTIQLGTLFREFLAISSVTMHDWRYESSSTFTSERTTTYFYSCPAKAVCEIQQVVGTCSNYNVRSEDFRVKTS